MRAAIAALQEATDAMRTSKERRQEQRPAGQLGGIFGGSPVQSGAELSGGPDKTPAPGREGADGKESGPDNAPPDAADAFTSRCKK
jgi:hypothetical protein